MKKVRTRSLQWVLVRRLILLQAATLLIFIVLCAAALWIANPRLLIDNEAAAAAVKDAVDRDSNGRLIVRDTQELAAFRESYPNVWYIVRDASQSVRFGTIPDVYTRGFGDLLGEADHATIGFSDNDMRPEAYIEKASTKAGTVQIIAATQSWRQETDGLEINISATVEVARNPDGSRNWERALPALALVIAILLLPIILVMGTTTLVTTPAVVRRSLAGLVDTVRQAARIDVGTRAMQLPVKQVPQEIAPLVQAFNEALARLAQGYDRHNRFLTDAAHELRTPIAILRTRAELLKQEPQSMRLLHDIERLSHLAQQLLDHQLLDRPMDQRQIVDLADLVSRVAADFAPLAIEAGYDLAFEPSPDKAHVEVNVLQIERALANLVRNAIEHGGGGGTITIAINGTGGVEVRDEGPGIPADEHENVFEPFYRLQPQSRGAGLGLNLARQIALLHDGTIRILTGSWRGARIRMDLPVHS
ncbi:MAG: HAMP domain-containing histidine kinase [Mesorhizobium sp.]|nr:HAMP domain-containing histidine kinase [bacterium M00.F.Ca.ET.205.01.1.1]TGU48317.1 HAMP domain-containing histidine kinase [bacterium M00.F.Ca.ET.152.01.1.1]TGV32577.1 HAMP domain-containing histidine kinase [Mesorhizobium sp. M00.F.Ca.ET.186.01.1.1]TGZ39834.1 HAMP domain-containing histidine kinase [bacterium M00.F.Ca.ET.162.01.1.1]TIW60494.1 MAG: HAMP domain-containing histidine kinase [Mesorhizobium sp.]